MASAIKDGVNSMSEIDVIRRQVANELRRRHIYSYDTIQKTSRTELRELAEEISRNLSVQKEIIFDILAGLYGDPTIDAPSPK